MKKVEESDNADLEFRINFLMLFLSTMVECNSCGHCNPVVLNYLTEDTDISSIDWSKYVFDCLRTGHTNREKNTETFYSGPITFLTLLYADLTECKKFEVERRWPAITVWNMDYLRRREYLELKDGGFGTWPLIADDGTEKDRSPDDFVERTAAKKVSSKNKLKEYKDCIRSKMDSILAQKQSTEMLIDNAISNFPLDRDLRIMSRELQSMFRQEDTSIGDVVNNETQIQLFHTPKRTAKGSKKRMDKESRDMEKSPVSTAGMQIVPGASLVDSPIWNSPRTHMELDNSFISYAMKMQNKNTEIPKFDLGISPDKTIQNPQPLSFIPSFKKLMFSPNAQVESICDAPKASRRDANLGESLRSPYVKRYVEIDKVETSSEKKICNGINASTEPTCESIFETKSGAVALRGTIESLCARTQIYSNVIDSWAALVNYKERFRNKSSPRRLFMHSAILSTAMLDSKIKDDVKLDMFVDNLLAAVGGDANIVTFKSIDLLFFPIVRDMHYFVVVFNFKRPSILVTFSKILKHPTNMRKYRIFCIF